MPAHRRIIALTLVVTACSSSGRNAPGVLMENPSRTPYGATAPVIHAESNDSIVDARFQNVRFHVWPGVALHLDELHGRMLSLRPDRVVSFDDPKSFLLDIDTATVGLTMPDLSRLMNTYVFAYHGAPLRNLSFTIENHHLVQRGIMHKVVDIPFEMIGDVSVTPEGEIKIHPMSMKICSINGQGLMKALGVTLAKLLDLRGAKGIRVAGNDLFLNPTKILPPPAIAGHLVGVDVVPGMLVQHFGGGVRAVAAMQPDSSARNYMLFRGGTLEFGKLFMIHSDMQVIDLAPINAFDFDINRYHEQLVGGFHRTLPDDGLLVFMPDVDST